MRLLKGLVIGLLIERGLGQTDSQSADDNAVATLSDTPTETGGADAPAPEPSAPSGGGGGDSGGNEESTSDPGPQPEPSSGDGVRIPVDESAPVDPPTTSSDVVEPSNDEQPSATGESEPTDADAEASPTEAESTDVGTEPSPTDAAKPTDTNEDQPSNTRAELVGPTLTGDDSEPTVTNVEPTTAASDGADNGGDSNQGTDSPVASPTAPLGTESDKDKPVTSSETGGSDPSAAGGAGDSPETTGLPDEPKETKEANSNPDAIPTGSSNNPPKASAPAATSKGGFTTVTGSKSAPTGEAYEIPVDLKDDTVLGDYAEFKEASNGDQVVLLKPPANGKANCEIAPTGGEVDNIPAGEYIRVLLSIKVEKVGASNTKDGNTGSRLKMLVDENTVYDKELVSTSDGKGLQDIESDPFKSVKNQKIRMIQESGEEPVELTIQDANIRVSRSDKTDGGGGGKGGDGNGSGSEPGNRNGNDESGSGGNSGGDSGTGSGSDSGSGSGNGDKGSGGGNGGSDSSSGSGSESGSGSGTGDAASPSSTTNDGGQTNVAGRTQTVREMLMYTLPFLVALMR